MLRKLRNGRLWFAPPALGRHRQAQGLSSRLATRERSPWQHYPLVQPESLEDDRCPPSSLLGITVPVTFGTRFSHHPLLFIFLYYQPPAFIFFSSLYFLALYFTNHDMHSFYQIWVN